MIKIVNMSFTLKNSFYSFNTKHYSEIVKVMKQVNKIKWKSINKWVVYYTKISLYFDK